MNSRQINKNGWLFRIVYFNTHKDNRPTRINLCSFMGHALLALIFFIILGCAVALMAVGVGFILYQSALVLWSIKWHEVAQAARASETKPLWVLLGEFMGFCLVFVGLFLLIGFREKFVYGPVVRLVEKFEPMRIIRDYLRAKKEKICPTYDVVD